MFLELLSPLGAAFSCSAVALAAGLLWLGPQPASIALALVAVTILLATALLAKAITAFQVSQPTPSGPGQGNPCTPLHKCTTPADNDAHNSTLSDKGGGTWGGDTGVSADSDLYGSNASSTASTYQEHQGRGSPDQSDNIWGNRELEDISDAEFLEIRAKALGLDALGSRMHVSNIFLRIPDADPDDLAPGAREHLVAQVEAHFPNTKVLSCCFHRGSLLMSLVLATTNDPTGTGDRVIAQPASTWLRWLGMPQDSKAQLQVNVRARGISFLDSLPPLAVVELPSDRKKLALRLESTEPRPEGVFLCASLAGLAMPLTFSPVSRSSFSSCSSCSSTNSDVSHKPSGSTVTIRLPHEAASWIDSHGGMLTIEARCVVSKQVQGWMMMQLLPPSKQAVAKELMLFLFKKERAQMHGHGHGHGQVYGQGQGLGHGEEDAASEVRQFINSVGLWMEQARSALSCRQAGAGAAAVQPAGAAPMGSDTDFSLVRLGARLLNQLVQNGLPAAADMVLQLLSSPSLTSSVFVEAILQGSAHPQRRSLMHLAVLSGDRAMVEQVLNWCKDFDVSYDWTGADSQGMTALHLALLANSDTSLPWIFNCCPEAQEASASHLLAGSLMQLRQKMVRVSLASRIAMTPSRAVVRGQGAWNGVRVIRSEGGHSIQTIMASAMAASASAAALAAVEAEAEAAESEAVEADAAGSEAVEAEAAESAAAEAEAEADVDAAVAGPSSPASVLLTTIITQSKQEAFITFRLRQLRYPAFLCSLLAMTYAVAVRKDLEDARAPFLSLLPVVVGFLLYLAETWNLVVAPKPERHFGKGMCALWLINIAFMTSSAGGLLRPPLQSTYFCYQMTLALMFNCESLWYPTHMTRPLPALLLAHALFVFFRGSFGIWGKLLCVAVAQFSWVARSSADLYLRHRFDMAEQQRCKMGCQRGECVRRGGCKEAEKKLILGPLGNVGSLGTEASLKLKRS